MVMRVSKSWEEEGETMITVTEIARIMSEKMAGYNPVERTSLQPQIMRVDTYRRKVRRRSALT